MCGCMDHSEGDCKQAIDLELQGKDVPKAYDSSLCANGLQIASSKPSSSKPKKFVDESSSRLKTTNTTVDDTTDSTHVKIDHNVPIPSAHTSNVAVDSAM